VLVLAVIAVMAPANFDKFYRNLTTDIVYKGKKEQGLFGSRQSPWQETVSSLKVHPWFGTGFGTSSITKKGSLENITAESGFYTPEGTNREHGNSYLAMAEYLGLLGVLPFLVLLGLIVRMIVQVCRWMRATAEPNHFAIPLAMILLAGLVHAFFEDWLLAVGYYICLFFWISAFLLDDLRPDRRPFRFAQASPAHPRAAAPVQGLAVPNQ
jgi:O-antigen ligase